MGIHLLDSAINKLKDEFQNLNWTYYDFIPGVENEKKYKWPGILEEEIMLTVHKSNGKQELFHRHDFFYFNYTYKGQYNSLSCKYDNMITIKEEELYAGQPFAGHALCVLDNQEVIIIGVLIQKEVFFRSFLPMLSSNSNLFNFFLDPVTKNYTDEFIHFKIEDDCNIKALLEMMVIEYAYKQEDTQSILKSLTLAFLMQIARQYAFTNKKLPTESISEQMVQYISENFNSITLDKLAKKFYYHPNYISNLLTKEIGKSFSEILLEQRMERALILLKGSTLSIEEIANILGYANNSSFYRAFKEYYHATPRNYLKLDNSVLS